MKAILNTLVSALSKKEGRKVEVSVGNLREVLSVLKKLCDDPEFYKLLSKYLCK